MQETGLQLQTTPKRILPKIGAEVYDRQAQEMRLVTVEAQALMGEAHGKIMQAQFNKSLALCMIRDRGLYAQWGYDTFAAYIESEWDFGYRQANRYAQIGEKITMMISAAESDESVDGSRVAGLLSGIGNSQWQQLVLLSDDELKNLATIDEYVGPRGEVFTLSQISEMATKELKDQLAKQRNRAEVAQGRVELLESEIQDLKAMSGDAGAAGEVVAKMRQLEGELAALRGAATKREQAMAELGQAEEKLKEGLGILRKYQPLREADFDDAVLGEVMAGAAARAAEYAAKLSDIASRYQREHERWSGA